MGVIKIPFQRDFSQPFACNYLIICVYSINDARDAIGDAHGELQFEAELIEDQLRGMVLSLPGEDDQVIIDTRPQLQVGAAGQDFSVAYWLNLQEGHNGKWRLIMQKGAFTNQRTFAMWMRPSDNRILIAASTTANNNENISSQAEIPLNEWMHIAYVKEGGKLKLYLNGKLDVELNLSGTTVSNDASLFFGANRYYTTAVSKLDDVRLYGYPLAVSEVFTLATERSCDVVNLALNQTTKQSSNYPNAVSDRAVDGNTSGLWEDATIANTQNEQNAWWEVDLGDVYDLSHINIWNRTDCCPNRLANFHVLVSDTPFDSQDLSASINQPGVRNIFFSGSAGEKTVLALNKLGRYVRIQLAGANFLQLAEVEVIGCAASELTFSTRMMLEGAYNEDQELMTDMLRVGGHLTLQDPYGLGAAVDPLMFDITGESAIVDWVKIEIRDDANPDQFIAEKACLLQRNGEVVDVDGSKDLTFTNVPREDYYIVVGHRNHLYLATATALDLSEPRLVDFSDLTIQVFGANGAGKEINNMRMLISGDANGDGAVNATDKNLHWRPENGGNFDYNVNKADFNLDGGVNALDKNVHWRKNNSRFERIP